MKELRRRFERFCARHADKGIHNLMLYVAVGNAIVYLFYYIDPSLVVYRALCFNRTAILHGQVWRLLTYVLIPETSANQMLGLLLLAIMLFFYYFIGRTIENSWGTLKFNLFYLTGIILTDLGALVLGVNANASYLNLSLILAYATLFPENRVLLMMIIPIRMKYLAWFYFALTIFELVTTAFPYDLFPVFALLNYFLFFGAQVLDVLPAFLRRSGSRSGGGGGNPFRRQARPNAHWASGYHTASPASEQTARYSHKCTICGRTDTEYPELEFRYCSQCNGYYCYCQDHISNHIHIV